MLSDEIQQRIARIDKNIWVLNFRIAIELVIFIHYLFKLKFCCLYYKVCYRDITVHNISAVDKLSTICRLQVKSMLAMLDDIQIIDKNIKPSLV